MWLGQYCPGRDAIGPCRCSRCWRHRRGTIRRRTSAQEAHRLGTPDGPATARWLPQRSLVLVGDNGYAVLDLLHCCQSLSEPVTLIARLRLDAALYAPAPPRQPGQNGRPALKGARRPSLKALLEQPPATDQPQVTWTSATVGWYDGATRTVELTSQTAVGTARANPRCAFAGC